MRRAQITPRTALVAALAVTAPFILDLYVRVLGGSGSVFYTALVSDYGEAALVAAVAGFIIVAAFRFGVHEPAGRNWLLIGMAAAMFALGDAVYGYYEVVQPIIAGAAELGEAPYPGVPDIFYLASYVFLAWGLIRAALAYRGFIDVRMPLAGSAIAAIVLLITEWFLVLQTVLAAESSAGETFLNVFYPVADVVLAIAPALFIVLVVSQMSGGRLAWPWMAVAVGAVIIAFADSGYAYLAATDQYVAGAITDLGWALGYAAFAIGASLARDVFDI